MMKKVCILMAAATFAAAVQWEPNGV